jgi:hypothetical protein
MAKTIGQLTDATSVGASDEIIVQQSGVTKRATVTELKTQVAALGANNITVSGANRSITNTDNYALSFGTNNATRVTIPAAGGISITTGSPDRISAPYSNDAVSTLNFGSPNSGEGNFQIQYDRTGGSFRFFGGSTGSQSERMRIDSSGNVGIGTTSPSGARLRTVGPSAFGQALVVQSDGSASNWARMDFINQNVPSESVILAQTNTGTFFIRTEGNHDINFATNGDNSRMRITGGGLVGIGTTSPNAAALLDVSSTTKGFLPPRMTTAQRDAISTPPAGLVIYNTTTNVLNFYNGSAWGAV